MLANLVNIKPGKKTKKGSTVAEKKRAKPSLNKFIKERDYAGALTLIEFNLQAKEDVDENTLLWKAYCAFHCGDYRTAYEVYRDVLTSAADPSAQSELFVYAAMCLFFLGMYQDAQTSAAQAPDTPLKNRLLFHCAARLGSEEDLLAHHGKLKNVVHDQMALASIHYSRGHYQEAIEVYKRLLLEDKEHIALNVFIALCYYKMDYYDMAAEVLGGYLSVHPDSMLAVNLKACNAYRLYNGKAGEMELKPLVDLTNTSGSSHGKDLIKHNLVVFRHGDNALQVLPPLTETVPEARLNLVIHHLQNGEPMEAYNLMKDHEPSTPQEYILKGIVNCEIGQIEDSQDHLKYAQQYFQLIGVSPTECDTIPGRQCMASCFFLLKQWEDVLVYLGSVQNFFPEDDTFNWNFGVANAAAGRWKEAEDALSKVTSEAIRSEFVYNAWLARAYIANGAPDAAWELIVQAELAESADGYSLLTVVATDFYKNELWLWAARAYDKLERVDASVENWEGKRGACIAVFRAVVTGHEPRKSLVEVVNMLEATQSNPQVEYITRVMVSWARDNGMNL